MTALPAIPTITPLSTSMIIDTETLSRKPGSVITEIGMIAFNRADFTVVDELSIRPSLWEQLAAGRMFCRDTIAFHQKNGTLPENIAGPSPLETIMSVRKFIATHRPEYVWIQGPDFDRPLIEDFFDQFSGFCEQFDQPLPWEYWRTRDTRTAYHLAFPGKKHAKRPHTALGDCKATLKDLAESLIALNRKEAA